MMTQVTEDQAAYEVVALVYTQTLAVESARLSRLQSQGCNDARVALCRARVIACNAAIEALSEVLGDAE